MENQDIDVTEDFVMDLPENQEGLLEIQFAMSYNSDQETNDSDEDDGDGVSADHMFAITATCKKLLGDIMDDIEADDTGDGSDESSVSPDEFIEGLVDHNPENSLYSYEQYKRFWRDISHDEMNETDYEKYAAVVKNEDAMNS